MIVACGAVAVLAGCMEDFDPASLIARNRVLGARLEVAADPARAWPEAGEDATLSFLVVDETLEARPLSWAFMACVPMPARSGLPSCAGEPIGIALPGAPVAGVAPSVSFTTPSAEVLADVGKIAVLGILCADGTPVFDPKTGLGECEGAGAQSTLTVATVRVGDGETTNLHPALDPEATTIGGVSWGEWQGDASPEDCSAAGTSDLPVLAAGEGAAEIVIAPTDASREEVDGTREVLILSQYATDGTMERTFSILDDSTSDSGARFNWTPPKTVAAPGEIVRFVFVLRDQRGGVAWSEHYACVY